MVVIATIRARTAARVRRLLRSEFTAFRRDGSDGCCGPMLRADVSAQFRRRVVRVRRDQR